MDPAERNNIVGFKPTRGLVANDGTIPISSRQDVVGALTRTVKDASYLLNTMAGRSDADERTWEIPFETIPNFAAQCNGTDITGIRVGVPRNSFPADPESPVIISFENALGTLKSAGAEIVDNADLPAADDFKTLNQQVKGIVRSSEFKRDIRAYLASLTTNPNNLQIG